MSLKSSGTQNGAMLVKADAPSDTPATFKLEPLDFELPRAIGEPPSEAVSPGPDTILRLDDAPLAEVHGQQRDEAEQASVQFRLVRFASAVEQASDLQRAGQPANAIAVLRLYVLRDEHVPTLMWLMLFDLYRVVNKKPVYEALADHFHRRYKRHMAGWEGELSDKAPQVGLAALPQLQARIDALWGTSDGLEMLRALICDRDQSDEIVFNAQLQRELLDKAKMFPLEDSD